MRRMVGDMAVVIRQEWLERLAVAEERRSLAIALVAAVGFFGVVIPWAAGTWWAGSLLALLVWSWMPMFMVADVAADTFAGARERNTLETLLASRLQGGAILAGKLVAVAAYAWLLLAICFAAGLLTAILAHGLPVQQPPLGGLALLAVAQTLIALFAAAAGVTVSIQAPTRRQAQQLASVMIFAGFLLFTIAVARLAGSDESLAAALMATLGLAAVDAGLVAWLVVRFRRTSLLASSRP